MTVIKIKNSSVAGKEPTDSDIVAAELALNLADKKLYSKDTDGNIFEIGASDGAQVPGGDTPPTNGNEIGDLFFDTINNQLLYWDGTQWVPIAGDEVQNLDDLLDVDVDSAADGQVLAYDGNNWVAVEPATLAVDVDLGYTPAADGGTVTNTAGDDAAIPMANGTTAGLSLNDFSEADKEKLDGIEAEAQVNPTLNDLGYLTDALGDDDDELGLKTPDTSIAHPTQGFVPEYKLAGCVIGVTRPAGTSSNQKPGKYRADVYDSSITEPSGFIIDFLVAPDGGIGSVQIIDGGGNNAVASNLPIDGHGPNATINVTEVTDEAGWYDGLIPNLNVNAPSGYIQSDWNAEHYEDAYIKNKPLNSGDTEPGTPSHGDIWVDTSECPPVLKIYVDEAECPGEGGWQEIEGGTVKPIEPEPGDGSNSITPTPPGSGVELDPYILTPKTVNYGGTVQTDETISYANQKPGALVQFVDQNAGTNGTRYTQPIGVIGADGTWSGKLSFSDTPDSTVDTVYTGLLKIGSSSIYYSWSVTSEILVTGSIDAPVEIISPEDGAGVSNDLSPDASDVVWQSANGNPLTVPFSGDSCKLVNMVWELRSSADNTTYTPVTGSPFTQALNLDIGETVPEWDGPPAGLEEDTYYKAIVTYNSEQGVDPVTSDEITFKTASGASSTASMNGLRFDKSRSTTLTYGEFNQNNTFSLSFWVKRTNLDDGQNILGDSSKPGSKYLAEMYGQDLYVFKENSSDYVIFNVNWELNVWIHILVTGNSGTFKCWKNGSSISINNGSPSPPDSVSFPNAIIGGSGSGALDNYLSDVYFVDGQALEPSDFGDDYDGLWGPLDSSVVTANIGDFGANGFYLPFDPSDIGVDASGNGNHFHDQNFAVGNTSQVWRDYSTGNAMSNVANAFDGSTSTNASISGPVGVVVPPVIFDGWNISDVTKVRVYGYHTATNKNGIQVNDLDVVSNIVGWTDVYSGPAITFDKLTISSLAAGNSLILFAVEVNGQILIDANIQDTVVDTPVKNYAVLETGSNGNLVGSGNLSYSGEAGTTYYYETNGVAKTGTAPISGLPSGTHNFGQQPFADRGPNGSEETLYQEFEGYQKAGGYFYDEKNYEPVRGSDLRKRFGTDEANNELGIYDLTEQPTYPVDAYLKVSDKYQPIRDYTSELAAAQAEAEEANARLDAANETIETMRSDFEARIAALENP